MRSIRSMTGDTIIRALAACAVAGLAAIAHAVQETPATPPPPSAAELYRQAFALLQGNPEGGTPPLLTPAERNALLVTDPRLVTPETRLAHAKVKPVLELVRQATIQQQSDFGLDRSRGFEMLLPHLQPMRDVAIFMAADTAMNLADGNFDAARENLSTGAALAAHASQDSVLISSLVSTSIGALTDRSIDAALESGAVDATGAQELLTGLDRLGGSDPFGYAEAIDAEAELFRTSITNADAAGDDDSLRAMMAALGPIEDAEMAERFDGLTRETVMDQLAVMDMTFDRAAEAFRNPDPEAARQMLAEIDAQVASGELGLVAQMLMPPLTKVHDSKRRGESMLAARMAQLRDIASGRVAPEAFANAALWYIEAARATQAIPEDEQRLIEGFRSVDGAIQGPLRVNVDESISRHRAVVDLMLKGARAGRCRFAPSDSNPPQAGLPIWAGGLRGAARVVIADLYGLVDAATGNPDEFVVRAARDAIAERFRAIIRLVDHLSQDPALPHSILAHSILDECRIALAAIQPKGILDEATLAPIATAVAALNRVDPLGVRRAIVADRERLAAWAAFRSPAELRAARRSVLDRLDGSTILALGLTRDCLRAHDGLLDPAAKALTVAIDTEEAPPPLECDCGNHDFTVLVDLSDLYDTAACMALWPRVVELWLGALFTADDPDVVRRSAVIAGEPLPVVVDVTALTAMAPGLVGEIDALMVVRPEAR